MRDDDRLRLLFIMSKAWSEKNNVAKPQNFIEKEETFAVRNMNGTGPYMLKSREVDIRRAVPDVADAILPGDLRRDVATEDAGHALVGDHPVVHVVAHDVRIVEIPVADVHPHADRLHG